MTQREAVMAMAAHIERLLHGNECVQAPGFAGRPVGVRRASGPASSVFVCELGGQHLAIRVHGVRP